MGRNKFHQESSEWKGARVGTVQDEGLTADNTAALCQPGHPANPLPLWS